jgi:hypothetical protein
MNSLCKSLLLIRTFVMAASFTLFTHMGLGQVNSGSGTAGKIPVWTGAHSQGNSVITQSGSKIGIGTAAPTALLSVNSGTASPAILARDTVNGPAVWGVGNTGFGLRGDSTSYVGVAGHSTNFVGVTGSGPIIGVFGASSPGTGVYGASTDGAGLVAQGQTGAVLNAQSANVTVAGDGLDVGGAGGFSDAVYAAQPSGDANYSFYGYAHIHGSNLAADDHEIEVVYQGAMPLALGRVVALDPVNVRGGPLGVVPATADNADVAIGVISYRLTTGLVNGVVKPGIDGKATAVQPGDRAYLTILGRVAMALPPGAKVGTRLAVGADGAAVVAAAGATPFGRVASQPDATGRGDVLVNFK